MKSTSIIAICALFAQASAIQLKDYGGYEDQSLVKFRSDIRSENDYDDEYDMIDQSFNPRHIIDEDGDGVEDNQHHTQDELDRYRHMVFGVAIEDLHNTHNGELPGHVRYGDSPEPTYPKDPHYEQIKREEARAKRMADAQAVAEAKGQDSPSADEIAKASADPEQKAENATSNKTESDTANKTEGGADTANKTKEESAASNKTAKAEATSTATEATATTETAAVEINAENLSEISNGIDISDSFYDTEYIQTGDTHRQQKLARYVQLIDSPEDLNFLEMQKTRKAWRRRITDADGDGVEDNIRFSADDLDEYYDPLVFGVAEGINNTHHGNLPGQRQLEFYMSQTEPKEHKQDIVNRDWATS